MGAQVKLVKRYDGGAEVNSLSLYANEEGFSLALGGWAPAIAGDGDASVVEALSLLAEGDDHDDLATKLQALATKLREIKHYRTNAVEIYGIWLRAQLADETNARRALVLSGRNEIATPLFSPPVSPGSFIRDCQLALARMPYWESTTLTNFSAPGVDGLGGSYDYTYYEEGEEDPLTVVGDVPSRIMQTRLKGNSSAAAALHEFWLGFRTERFGVRANFVPVWECEIGDVENSTAVVADATASGGSKTRCTFGDESMLHRVTVELEDGVTANYRDQRGEFAVLLRAKVSAGTCQVRLLDGFRSADEWRTQSRVKIDKTDWFLYSLGNVRLPPVRGAEFYALDYKLRKFALRIEASRTSGAGNLEMDCLVLIPTAEGFIHVTDAAVQKLVTGYQTAIVRCRAEGSLDGCQSNTSSYPISSLGIEPTDYALPVGNGTLYLAAQRETQHVLTEGCNIEMLTYPRWLSLRGAE